jgi:glycosyltransferase involved in cell wall biosynthesis
LEFGGILLTGNTLTVVVPAYKKEHVVAAALLNLIATLEDAHIAYEIIVVVDGSPDETEAAVRRIDHSQVRVISYMKNQGKGHALRMGCAASTTPFVAFADADPDLDPKSLTKLIELLIAGDAMGAIGAKTHPDSIVHYPLARRVQSRIYRELNRALFGLTVSDTQTGLKVFRRDALSAALPYSKVNGYAFDLELLVLLNDLDMKVIEGPVHLNFDFSSTVPANAAFRILRDTFSLWKQRRIRIRTGWQRTNLDDIRQE